MVLEVSEGSGCITQKEGLTVLWCTHCYVAKRDVLVVRGLDKDIRAGYHHELLPNSCFSGKSAADGYEYQISLRTSPRYFEEVTVITTEKSGVNKKASSAKSSTWAWTPASNAKARRLMQDRECKLTQSLHKFSKQPWYDLCCFWRRSLLTKKIRILGGGLGGVGWKSHWLRAK